MNSPEKSEKLDEPTAGVDAARVELEPEQVEKERITLGSRVASILPPEAVRKLD